MSDVDLKSLPEMVLVEDEPVFNEPWEAQAFAIVINLHQNGAFSWTEWAEALSTEIHAGEQRSYYQHWLCALESLVASKNIATTDALSKRTQDWHDAAARTPHGEPILLQPK